MTNKLTILTLTDGSNERWLPECLESVRLNKPHDSYHVVQYCDNYQRNIWDAYKYNEYFAAVDSDDLVVNDSINRCVEALEKTGAGIAFTYEGQIDADGKHLLVNHRPVSLISIALHPRVLHHLAVIRTNCIDPVVWDMAKEFGVGIDWITKAWVAINYGAVQVPEVGYLWRRHTDCMSNREEYLFGKHMPEIRRNMMNWLGGKRSITNNAPMMVPQYEIRSDNPNAN